MAPEPLSVVVITLNEQDNIARCLRSVSWAEERLVVDAGSTDRTREIAAGLGAQVVERPWPGYVEQKNAALDAARHHWVLSLDADEWLPRAAAEELCAVLRAPRAAGYRLPRRTAFSGGFPRRAWGRDRQLRLFRRDAGRFSGGPVHESVRMRAGSRVELLRGPILHLGYATIAEHVERMNRYTDLAAEGLDRAGRGAGLVRMLVEPSWAFFRTWILRGACLDGVRGLTVSAGSAYYVLLKYAKLWERRRSPTADYEAALADSARSEDQA